MALRGTRSAAWRWIDALADAAKAVWYLFLRKSQLVGSVFAPSGPTLRDVERGNARVARPPDQRPAEYPRFQSDDPILRVLRQRAAVEIFAWLGLDRIPKGYWTLLERLGDPSRALIAFISNSRFDPTLVRKRDAAELGSFRHFVRFVCQMEESTDAVSARQRALLDRHTHFGEHAIVRSLLELFVILNEAAALFEGVPAACRLAAFARHVRRIATLREDGGPEDLPEARTLLEASRQHAQLSRRFRTAAERAGQLEATAGEHWATLLPLDRTIWAGMLAELAQTRSALVEDAGSDARSGVEDFEERVERLAAVLEEAVKQAQDVAAARERKRREKRARQQEEARRKREQRKAEDGGRGRPDSKGRDAQGLQQDELLAIFGFPPGTSPELRALKQAFLREAGKTQPVPGQPDYRQRNERYRLLKDAYKRLKAASG